LLSGDVPRRTVFTHLGWRQVDDRWAYLHTAGAIGADGPVSGVEIDPPAPLAAYTLADPPESGALIDAVRASLRLLKMGPARIMVPLLSAVYRSVLGSIDFSVHLSGPTGVFKSELAALCQQHHAAAGLYAMALAGFVRWLAPKYEGIRTGLKQEVAHQREHAAAGDQHARPAS